MKNSSGIYATMVAIATRWQILEGIIERSGKSFITVGNALLTIRDQELYREQFRNFKDYCADRWGIGRAHAARLITGSKVATNLLTRENFTNGAKMSPIGDNFNTLVKSSRLPRPAP